MFQKLNRSDLRNLVALEVGLGVLMLVAMLLLNRISVTEAGHTGAVVACTMILSIPIHYVLILSELRTERSQETE